MNRFNMKNIEQHPFFGCILYIVVTFFVEFFIDNALYAMCVVNFIFYFYVLYRRYKNKTSISLYRTHISDFNRKSIYILAPLLVFFLCITSQFWSAWYMATIHDKLSVTYSDTLSNINPYLYIFMVGIAAPFGEESLFRYIVFNGFQYIFRKYNFLSRSIFSILISSAIFAIMHGTGVHLIIGFIGGIAFSFTYFITNSLSASIIMHSIYNTSTLFLHLPSSLYACISLSFISFMLFVLVFYILHNDLNNNI